MRDGKAVVAVVVSVDAEGVVLRGADGKDAKTAWSALAPLGVYRARAAVGKPDDGPTRLALAELASDLGLWAEARAELERAFALKAISGEVYERAVADAEERAVATGVAAAERAADADDVAKALEIARRLKLDFAGAKGAKKIDALLASLDARIAQREAELDALQKEGEKALANADRIKEALARRTEARRQTAIGGEAAADARSLMPRGVVTRVRKQVDAADEAYSKARKDLGRLRRILPKDAKERTEADAALASLDLVQFKLLFDAAKFFADARVYDDAERYAAKASYIDPVDPRLLELREELRDKRIHYRLSDVTNARPR
jgi:hypothetical protein